MELIIIEDDLVQDGTHRVHAAFNNNGTIDLDDFERVPKSQFKDCEFSHYEFLDLESLDTESEDFLNVGIREGSDFEVRCDSFRVSFRNDGYIITEEPPCIDTDGDIIEGRTRLTAAKRNGEKWMPVAVYSRADKSVRNTTTNGLRANMKSRPQYAATFADFVAAGVHLINSGELDNTVKDVDAWLLKDVGIKKSFDNSINGAITKIRNAIMRRATQDESLILQMDAAACHKWIKKNLGLEKSEYVLVNMADNETYAERAWRHVRDIIKGDREPAQIIYYTTSTSPTEARASLKKSMKYLEDLYLDSWEVVNSQLPEAIQISATSYRPYKFMGAIPQIVQDHSIGSAHLVKVGKY